MTGPSNLARAATLVIASLSCGAVAASCAGVKPPSQQGAGGSSGSGRGGAGGSSAACKNLQCRQVYCGETMSTTLSGTVYAPDGKLPLYNVLVYVPNSPVPAIPPGLACDRCGAIPPGDPVVAALTDAHGQFTLKDVPVGANIPLVIQVGKWRRQITVPSVASCQANRIDDPEQTRLPRVRAEGNMPRIAITTGLCDNLVCLLPKLGIDPSELGVAGQDRAVTFFGGAEMNANAATFAANYGAALPNMTSASTLWSRLDVLNKYDMVIASCECLLEESNKGPAAYQAMTQYLAAGGRLFGTDQQYIWYRKSPDPAMAAVGRYADGAPITQATPITLDTTFPKGKALADWLAVVNPDRPYGEVATNVLYDNFTSVSQPPAQVWGAAGTMLAPDSHVPRVLTVNTPVGVPVAQQCGRAVHIDGHITPQTTWTQPFPSVCGTALENGEQALAFFLFDVAACIQEDSKPVMPPPVVP